MWIVDTSELEAVSSEPVHLKSFLRTPHEVREFLDFPSVSANVSAVENPASRVQLLLALPVAAASWMLAFSSSNPRPSSVQLDGMLGPKFDANASTRGPRSR